MLYVGYEICFLVIVSIVMIEFKNKKQKAEKFYLALDCEVRYNTIIVLRIIL